MSPRTNTTAQTTFTRPGSVTYTMPSPPPSPSLSPASDSASAAHVVTITLPPGSPWTSGLHWHATHTEYLRIMRGRALVTLGGVTRVCSAASRPLKVPRGVWHEWRRVPAGWRTAGGQDEVEDEDHGDLVVQEWTLPADGQKEAFFRNLNSVLLEGQRRTSQPMASRRKSVWWEHLFAEATLTLQLFAIFWQHDNFPVLIGERWMPGPVQAGLTRVVLWASSVMGGLVGVRGWYEEYTPERLRPVGSEQVKRE